MPKLRILAALAVLTCGMAQAQLPLSSQITEFFNTPPPAILNSTTSSTPTATGIVLSQFGGSIAAGTYRIAVTFFTVQGTETTGSIDTATTATVTTVGSTSTLTIVAPVSAGVNGNNVVGYRVYIGASGGATAAETLQTPTAANCTLSGTSPASCALGSNFVTTSSTNFIAGAGAPATNTALTPPLNNAANSFLTENSLYTLRSVYWVVSGTAPATCTFSFQTGATVVALANVGQAITCTATGGYTLPLTTTANFAAINVSALTPGDTTTRVTFYTTDAIFGAPIGIVNAVPTGNCTNGFTLFNPAGASASTIIYVCAPANTFTAVAVP